MRITPPLHPLACVLLTTAAAWAHASESTASPPGERLSTRILRQHGPLADTTALHWRAHAQRPIQAQWRSALLQQLERSLPKNDRLAQWLGRLPITGRLPLAQVDPYWLLGQPSQDPVLGPQDSVHLYPRPQHIALVNSAGELCLIPHHASTFAADYVRACGWLADTAWIAQPDSKTMQASLSAWNRDEQSQPAPGAWLWVPLREDDIASNTSKLLIEFLATQEPGERLFADVRSVFRPNAPHQSTPRPVGMQLTASDWGEIGLLQTPSARMMPAGELRMHFSKTLPYTHGTLLFQPFDWMEAAVRYTDVSNRLYGPTIAGDQSYKDKSLDLKLRLMDEGPVAPALAVGVRDIGGTGLFSGEYLVANKRFGDWDTSLGLGWGYLGNRANMNNPLGWADASLSQRAAPSVGQGGVVNTGSMFSGAVAAFGGVQWSRSDSPWVFKAEIDGNHYQNEPQGNNQRVDSPFNLGVVYRYRPDVDVTAGWERGNTWMFGFTLHGDTSKFFSPKTMDRSGALSSYEGDSPTEQLRSMLGERTGWRVLSLHSEGTTTTLVAELDEAPYLQERIDRAVSALHQHSAPASHQFLLQLQRRGLPMLTVRIDRRELTNHLASAEPSALRLPAVEVQNGRAALDSTRTSGEWTWSPSYSQILGGPNNFLLYQAGVQTQAELRLSPSTWFTGTVNARLADNYGGFVYDAPSDLPRVRTNQRSYVTTSVVTMPQAYASHTKGLGGDHYVGAYGGLLEPMFGGIGAEWLYRPYRQSWAVGLDWNLVRQREFSQNLAFQQYGVGTGHASAYWDTGWSGVHTKLSLGRYLAGDWGATIDLSRRFPNGVSAGVWATKTNVSAEAFGEGSFDKGVYLHIPFDAIIPKSSSGTARIVWSPLTRDGGARLQRPWTLWDLTQARSPSALQLKAAAPHSTTSGSNRVDASVLKPGTPHIAKHPWTTAQTVTQQVSDIPPSTWAWGIGAVALSSLTLDAAAQRWAQTEHSHAVNLIGKASNYTPYALAFGAGALALGIGGEPLANTSITALTAGAYTLGANALLRSTLGRARPMENQGPAQFNGPGPGASQSGMPSNHVGLAFALATPFAQQYDMPWLYALAATSALGRVHSQEHWVSDTVAGALLGYGFGSILHQQQRALQRGWSIAAAGPAGVVARWRY